MTALMALLGIAAEAQIPIDAEKKALNLTDDQVRKLKAHFGDEYATEMLKTIDGEIKAHLDSNMNLKAIKDELDAIVKEKALKAEDLADAKDKNADEGDIAAKLELLNKAHSEEKALRIKLEEQVQALMKESEGDVPSAILKNLQKDMKHSDTHLFASTADYNAFDKRPWNMRFRDGNVKATDFNNDSNIPTLQGDLEHFVRENPTVINSLFNDFDDLPAEWDRRSGVLDRVADGYVITGEIVQGRKKGFQAKNRFKFSVEEGKVYRKKIDITFDGYELQQIENTWLRIKNSEKSHPWKMSFIGFLLSELVKRQKADDRNAQINGIYVINPDEDTAGAAVNSQNGLLYLWYYYREIAKKYRPFDMGAPTDANIKDYIEDMIKRIPENERKEEGYEIELSDRWMKAYRKRAGELYQLNYNTDTGMYEYKENHPVDYPNFKFQVLKDMTKTDFIGITKSKNIQIMDYDVSEKGKFTITHEKRDTHIFADYRLGIRFLYVGNKLAPGEPNEFEVQKVWSNNVPVFGPEVSVPTFDDQTGILKVVYPNMVIDEKWKTDITSIEGDFVPGQVIKITGNPSLAGAKNLKDNAVFDLQGDYALNTPGYILLFVNDDKTLKELERTTVAPVAASTDVNFDAAVVDAKEGTVFRYTGAATRAITGIINGVDQKSIRIYGTDTANVDVTFSTTGNIKMTGNATLGKKEDYVQLTLVAGFWRETKRVIAP